MDSRELQLHKILVTGATGFIGGALIQQLSRIEEIRHVAASTRQNDKQWPQKIQPYVINNVDASTNWTVALANTSVVVHCAARVHVMNETAKNSLDEFRKVNVLGTLNLARQAAAAGTRRFVFISSVKVNGEETKVGAPFTAEDAPAPMDAYGISKMEAEQGLWELSRQTGMEVVTIRPPLVYGPGVKANFAAMIRLLQYGVPLPLGAIQNQRSLVALDNLIDLILVCLKHPAAAGQTFFVSDGEDVSTTELLRRMGRAMECPVRLIPVPINWLKFLVNISGRKNVIQRLCGSLQVDIRKTRQLLDWNPPISLDQGLKKVVQEYEHEANI